MHPRRGQGLSLPVLPAVFKWAEKRDLIKYAAEKPANQKKGPKDYLT